MPACAPVPFAPFWGHDDAADPLAGGALYAYAAGTDSPLATYANPQGTTLNPHPVVLDDAGYAHVYLHSGTPYKLRLVNNLGVQQWEIDQVYGAGAGGGSSLAGVGWGKNTVAITPANGASQASAAVFPPDVLAFGLTVWVQTGFGTSQGVQAIGLGTPTLPDAWGMLSPFATDDASTAGMFLAYSGQPQPASGVVTLTAYGGLFDGAGTLYATGHFFTLTPGQEVGYSYVPGVPETGQILPPQPPATETQQGLVELIDATEVLAETDLTRALTIGRLVGRTSTESRVGLTRYGTPAETTTGTLATVATHPAGVKAALDAKVPSGPALSVPRYAAGGLTLEATPGLVTTSDGRLGVGATPAATDMLRLQALGTIATCLLARYEDAVGAMTLEWYKSRGTAAAPTRVNGADHLGNMNWRARTRNSGDTADADVVLALLRGEVEAVDAQGRASGRLLLYTSTASAGVTEKLRLTASGQLGLLTTAPTAPLDINGDTLRLRTARTPASATAAGEQGAVCWDANYIYVAVGTNQWKRAPLTTW